MKIRTSICMVGICLLMLNALAFAGTEWETQSVTKTEGKESTIIMHAYAQGGNIRQDITEVKGSQNAGMEKGTYILYLSGKNTMTLVNPKEKSYTEMDFNSLGQLTNNQVMNVTITNPKVAVEQMGSETVDTYNCKHIKIVSSYDMEMKVVFITTKTHIEQTIDVWGTDAYSLNDFNKYFLEKGVSTSIKELDALLQKQAAAYKNLGFVIKSVMTQTSTDLSNKNSKPQISTTDMTVSKISQKNLKADLFQVPANYEKVEVGIPPEAVKEEKAKEEKRPEKTKEPKIDGVEILKGLFGGN